MIHKIKFIIVLSVILFIFIIFFIGLNKSNIYTPSKIENVELPRFESKELFSGIEIDSQDIIENSDYSLINIWASWCVPCREEHSILVKIKKKIKLNIIGINYKDKKSNAAKFLSDLGNPYHEVLIDLDGTKSIEFGAIGVPETYLINNKIIVKKYIGPLDQSKLKDIIEIIKNEKK